MKHYVPKSAFVQLNIWLQTATEEAVLQALEAELRGPHRESHIRRLHQKFSMLRNNRERAELLGTEVN